MDDGGCLSCDAVVGGTTYCVLQYSGSITGGQICQNNCTLQPDGTIKCTGDGTWSDLCVGGLAAGIKTNSGNGNVFVIRPSAVIGLLTDARLVKNSITVVGTSSARACCSVVCAVIGRRLYGLEQGVAVSYTATAAATS